MQNEAKTQLPQDENLGLVNAIKTREGRQKSVPMTTKIIYQIGISFWPILSFVSTGVVGGIPVGFWFMLACAVRLIIRID